MTKKTSLTANQREQGLIELIQDSKKLKFDSSVIKKYTSQLKEVQEEIKRDKKRVLNLDSKVQEQDSKTALVSKSKISPVEIPDDNKVYVNCSKYGCPYRDYKEKEIPTCPICIELEGGEENEI